MNEHNSFLFLSGDQWSNSTHSCSPLTSEHHPVVRRWADVSGMVDKVELNEAKNHPKVLLTYTHTNTHTVRVCGLQYFRECDRKLLLVSTLNFPFCSVQFPQRCRCFVSRPASHWLNEPLLHIIQAALKQSPHVLSPARPSLFIRWTSTANSVKLFLRKSEIIDECQCSAALFACRFLTVRVHQRC